MDDHQIIELYWKRDESAITETADKYGRYITGISLQILNNPEDAAECTNDTYHDAWNAMPPHRPSILSAFLGKLARRISATFIYPQNTDFHSEEMQQWLRRVRVTALRRVASENLPRRLDYLSRRFNFCYNGVSLRDSHSRWGSCSSRGNISLSIYLQLLPEHLADYVMLHELCHTVEMNHSPRFWELMDNVTDGKSKQLRHELKSYRTSF